ncbi:MAG: DNA replication/repair protein RecF [Hyphomicrobiales bacterium]
MAASPGMWAGRLRLTDFRNYASLALDLDPRPMVLTGSNGAGKTNLMEALSLLAPGQGLRRVPYAELVRNGAPGGWAVAARLETPSGPHDIGTGFDPASGAATRSVRIDGHSTRPGALAEYTRMLWLTPANDGLFTGPAGDRRRFLDRLVQSLDGAHANSLSRYERAMRQRNRALEEDRLDAGLLEAFELEMAEAGVAVAAARLHTVERLKRLVEARASQASAFPWATLMLEGELETRLSREAAVDVEDVFLGDLARGRERDRAAGRALSGPHRSDLVVGHGPKSQPARSCSTGEQKALLTGLVLAQAALVADSFGGTAPVLLLDEIAAHLDAARREALFREISALSSQTWMTGTDPSCSLRCGLPRAS